MPVARDLTGRRFHFLVVLRRAENAYRKVRWLCQCDCGKTCVVVSQKLLESRTKSCGCYRVIAGYRPKTHGMGGMGTGKKRLRVYEIWKGMIQRCKNPNEAAYKYYGGRGISVCERWKLFVNFYEDMGDPPPGTSLDRIDVNGNYEQGNCRWADINTQNNNKRNTLQISAFGRTQTLSDWGREFGVNRDSLDSAWRKEGTIEPFLLRHGKKE